MNADPHARVTAEEVRRARIWIDVEERRISRTINESINKLLLAPIIRQVEKRLVEHGSHDD